MPPSPEALRSKLLRDPHTPKLAEQLGVPLEEYVRQVMHFVTHPQEEPQLLAVEDEDLRRLGHAPPSAEAMVRHLKQAAALAESSDRTDFTPAKKPLVALTDAPRASRAEAPPTAHTPSRR